MPEPTYTGTGITYSFLGWFTAVSDGTQITASSKVSITGNHTLYAHWSSSAVTYRVTYNPGSGITGTQQEDTKTYGIALTLRTAIFNRTGYVQTGWATSDGGAKVYELSTSYTANEPIALYPYWTPYVVTVSLDMQGGKGGNTAKNVTYDQPMPTITVPTKTGYIFDGYWTGTNGSGTQYYNTDGTSARTCDFTINTTLYAKWIEDLITTTFDSNDGE